MSKNGFAYTTLILTVLVVAAGFFGWYYYRTYTADLSFITDFFQPTALPNITGWKNLRNSPIGFELQYPPDWYNYNDQYLSKYPYSPSQRDVNEIYDAIIPSKVISQAHLGYNNDIFFNHLYQMNLGNTFQNEFYSSDKTIYTLLAKGKLRSGQKFVVYKIENNGITYGADILSQLDFYEFNLLYPDDAGVKTFIDIIKTVTIN